MQSLQFIIRRRSRDDNLNKKQTKEKNKSEPVPHVNLAFSLVQAFDLEEVEQIAELGLHTREVRVEERVQDSVQLGKLDEARLDR